MPPKKKQPQPLSLKELNVLEFIEGFMNHQGVVPTYQEIREHFGFASFNSVQRYLKQLQEKGYIHIPGGNQKRAIQILHPSNTFSNLLADRTHEASVMLTTTQQYPSLSQLKKETPLKRESPPQVESLSLPLLGRVAAGLPIEAFNHDEFMEVPSHMVRNPSKTFALIVQGQSMVEDGILDGDVVLVQKQTYAGNGETVVAMIENQATIKRFYLHNDPGAEADVHMNPQSHAHQRIELRPANSTMQSMWYSPNDVDIQGILVGLLRQY